MYALTQTNDKIQITLSGTVATNQAHCIATWHDITSTPSYVPGRSVAVTNNNSDVDWVASPPASTQRRVEYMSVYNNDTAPITATIRFDAAGTDYIMWKGVIGVGEHLEYDGKRWSIKTIGCLIKTLQTQSISTILNDLNTTIITSDVVNNDAVANTIADVTGLFFPVVSGEMYWFRFDILYTSAATTTGSRWSINGPGSPTYLEYDSIYSLAATTVTTNARNNSYDLPAAANASTNPAGNAKATIFGVIQPSSNGNVIARFASEISASAITAKAGSRVQWQRVL